MTLLAKNVRSFSEEVSNMTVRQQTCTIQQLKGNKSINISLQKKKQELDLSLE